MTASSGYSEGELLQMQQDAIRRVRQMQERARASVATQQGEWNSPGAAAPAPPQQAQAQQQGPFVQNSQGRQGGGMNPNPGGWRPGGMNQPGGGQGSGGQGRSQGGQSGKPAAAGPLSGLTSLLSGGGNSPLSGILNAIGGDRILILLLMVLLLGEEGDQTLILALCYLLLFD